MFSSLILGARCSLGLVLPTACSVGHTGTPIFPAQKGGIESFSCLVSFTVVLSPRSAVKHPPPRFTAAACHPL
ncbi:hypothetical protein B0T26DRAFT_710396 [Lasiosphaeria miniovina]|uniref:Secreted protein n=1 Tax=Lasiosphaeria miniovina TaxID=1954250 RepID=A0AA40AKP4_9PEZI|nr:uncharacterized protein B0T26DRAFT_710396 [Lasiosphaeria miniovina]KAK0717624.1 hypothetical protein B0T26DRAFT_710396 [Lasiosphaeria miniovina]